jgi:hypothetical protein
MKSWWSPEDSSNAALVGYSFLYSAIAMGYFLIFFYISHSSHTFWAKVALSLVLSFFLGGAAFVWLAYICIAELIKRRRA